MSILLVHWSAGARAPLLAALEGAGHAVAYSMDPGEASARAAFDLVALGDAIDPPERASECKALREQGYLGAIFSLASDPNDARALVAMGVDDYVIVPADPAEVAMRVETTLVRVIARVRRRWGALEVDRVRGTARVRGKPLRLTVREQALLTMLLDAAGEVVPRSELLARVWGRDEGNSNILEVHLSRLRDKLGEDAGLVETVRRVGYKMRSP